MKKGIVMEQHRKFTIVMTTDGLIEKAHHIKDADIGFEVLYEPFPQKNWLSSFKNNFFTMRVAALACVFLIALLPFYLVTDSTETYAYVDIDINPSMELEIDSDLEVSDIIPYNDDAKLILDQIGDLKGENIEDAIEIIINTSEEKGLINAARNVLIGVHYLKDTEKDPIIKTIEDHFDKKPTDWEVVTVVIPDEVRDKAEEKQQSMNKTLANAVIEKKDNQVKAIITEEDKEVLQSFFNTNKAEVEITNDKSSEKRIPSITTEKENKKHDEKGKSFKDKTHPSELKSKNGDINSNKNEDRYKNRKDNDHHKHKHQEKLNNGHEKNQEKANNGNGKNKEKSKHKENHNHKGDRHKDKQKDRDGKGYNGKNNNDHNGKGHENRGNNGNGKTKDDGYSYGFPLYK